jgi:glycosyl-4,4'-diaponeurosporenoate acyltransferase
MLIELPIARIAVLNVAAWLVIQLGLAWSLTRLPARRFHPRSRLARLGRWERSGRCYEQWLGVKRWKDWLPDGAGWLGGGFAKAGLRERTPEFLEIFLRETWRGEIVHWLSLLAVPVFAIWNPPWAVGVNAFYALLANLPCIVVQRHNRGRFLRVLDHTA